MSDRYTQIVNAPGVSTLAKSLGLPQPVDLDRFEPSTPVIEGPGLTGGAPDGRLRPAISAVLDSIGAERAGAEGRVKALVFDGRGPRRTPRRSGGRGAGAQGIASTTLASPNSRWWT